MTHPAEEKLAIILAWTEVKQKDCYTSCHVGTMREIAARMAELKAENTRLTFERNLVSQAIEDTVAELGCPPDNEEILFAITALRTRAETAEREHDAALAEIERMRSVLEFNRRVANANAALTKKETP